MDKLKTDAALLREFARNQDGLAFEELVRRYLTMVLGVALRRTGDHGAAEEIAQITFTVLARKAPKLPSDIVLGGWLHRVAAIEAADYNRKEYRRRNVMKKFKEASGIEGDDTVSEAFAELLPDLDVAMAALSARERDAIMLRFHGGLRFAEMAKRLGKSEEAARKQVSRAVDKLAALLGRKRGATIATTTLISGLPLALSQTEASAAMVQSVATSALSSLPASSSLTLLCLMKSQTIVVTMIGIILVAGTFFAGRQTAAGFGRKLIEQTELQGRYRQEFAAIPKGLRSG